MQNANDIRSKYLAFFEKEGHKVIPSSKLVPENDGTTLFTGSGMQQLVPFLLGLDHPEGTRLTDSQKCFRVQDIEEVGDNRHTTFFEMLGNWSLGDYGKEKQLSWFWSFLVDEVGLDPERLYVTAYAGDESVGIPQDDVTAGIWQKLFAEKGIEAKIAVMLTEKGGGERGIKEGEKIFFYRNKNWWSRHGSPDKMPPGEPGGPDSEVFYEFTDVEHDVFFGERCHPNCDCGRFLEIGNSVFMEYRSTENGFEKLEKANVDFGGGLERIAAAAIGSPDMFQISLLKPLIEAIEKASGKSYKENPYPFRVIADHTRAATFLLGDGVLPSNVTQGYVLRRLIRRSVRFADTLGVADAILSMVAEKVIDLYQDAYPVLLERKESILKELSGEEERFRKTLRQGGKQLRKLVKKKGEAISGEDLLMMHASFGYPVELSLEALSETELSLDQEKLMQEFSDAMDGHKKASRAGLEKKFGGHGLFFDNGELKAADKEEFEKVLRLHTATHLMQSALRKVLGEGVRQAGSDITAKRTRFDFSFERKLTDEEVKAVEDLVNEQIQKDLPFKVESMSQQEAFERGALSAPTAKYPDPVTVYYSGDDLDSAWSKEFCGGPHVEHLGVIGAFSIKKQEAVASGVRRVRAVVS